MDIGETLYVTARAEWRAWLQRNHARAKEIWLVYPNKASGEPRIPYNDAVDEAICFGWIDSTVKKLGTLRVAQRFTPRRRGSGWSELNKERLRRLHKKRLVTPAGFAAAEDVVKAREHVRHAPLTIAHDVLTRLKEDPIAWKHFQRFPASYKRIRIGWIEAARGRPAFEQRLAYFLRMTKQGKRYGMVQ